MSRHTIITATLRFGSKFQRYANNSYDCVPSLFERTGNEASEIINVWVPVPGARALT